MIPINLSLAEKSKFYLSCLQGLNVTAAPLTPGDAAKMALAEVCSMHLDAGHHSIAEIFNLAEDIFHWRDEHSWNAAVIYPVEEIQNATGHSMAVCVLAVRLCGARLIDGHWADGENGHVLSFEGFTR